MVASQVDESEPFQARNLRQGVVVEPIVSQVQIEHVLQIAEQARRDGRGDLVLLQVDLDQLRQVGRVQDVLERAQLLQRERRAVGRRQRRRQVQLAQIWEAGQQTLVAAVLGQRNLIVVEHESLDARRPVVRLAADRADAVVAHVDDAQVLHLSLRAEDVPRQLRDVVAREDQNLKDDHILNTNIGM